MTKVIQSTIAERQSEAASVPMCLGSKVFRQRTGLFDTGETKAMASLVPFTPLSYEGTAVAERAGTIATAKIPMVAGLTTGKSESLQFVGPQMALKAQAFRRRGGKVDVGVGDKLAFSETAPRPRRRKGESKKEFTFRKKAETDSFNAKRAEHTLPGMFYRCFGLGMADWLLGIPPELSRQQWDDRDGFNLNRMAYWDKSVPQVSEDAKDYVRNMWSTQSVPFAGSQAMREAQLAAGDYSTENSPVMIDAALPIGIRQFKTDEIATNYIANNKNRVVLGYTISSRTVKLFYTPAAIDMVVRRFNAIYQLFGQMNPRISFLGRGHLRTGLKDAKDPQGYKIWQPATSAAEAKEAGRKPYLVEPSLKWSCGAVPHNTKQLPANGLIYIDPNQFGYSQRKRFCKYNHVMTQLGLELLETFNAFGGGLSEMLSSMNAAVSEHDASTQVAGLQMLFSALYGTTEAPAISADDFTEEAGISNAHARAAQLMGMFFNPGHSHIDPGVLVYQNIQEKSAVEAMISSISGGAVGLGSDERWDTAFDNASGMLDRTDKRYNLRDMKVSAACLMNEAIGRLFTFSVMGAALSNHMVVPTVVAKYEYHNNAAAETVTQVFQMAHRPGIYADGSGSGRPPFDFIDSRITDEVIYRIPCYLRDTNKSEFNAYIGISSPDLLGPVVDKISEGGVCTTLLEGDDIQFTPIVRGNSGSMTTKRKGMTIVIAHLNRPEYYEPGVTNLGCIYGLMEDNASVGGDYFIQPTTGVLHDDRVEDTMFRALAGDESKELYMLINPDMNRAAVVRMTEWYEARGLKPWENFTYVPIDKQGNIDWEKWQLMYEDAGIEISASTWKRAIEQQLNMSRNLALYPPAGPAYRVESEELS